MSETYDAVYQAAYQRIGYCNVQSAIDAALRDAFGMANHHMQSVAQDATWAAQEYARPSAVYRPRIAIDGNMWCALYGDNIQEGVAGFGESPAKAMADFDKNWTAAIGATP